MEHGSFNMAITNLRASILTHTPTQSVETALKKICGLQKRIILQYVALTESSSVAPFKHKPQPKK